MEEEYILVDHAIGQKWEEPQVWTSDEHPELYKKPAVVAPKQSSQPALVHNEPAVEIEFVPCSKCGDMLVKLFAHEHSC